MALSYRLLFNCKQNSTLLWSLSFFSVKNHRHYHTKQKITKERKKSKYWIISGCVPASQNVKWDMEWNGMEGKPVIRKIVFFFFFFFNFCSTVVKFACNKTNGKQTVVEKEKRFKTVTGRCWQKYLLFFILNNYTFKCHKFRQMLKNLH